MPQKKARKATTTKRAAPARKNKPARKTLLQRIRGSVSKKGILVSIAVLAVAGLGVGGYALWKNNSASAANYYSITLYNNCGRVVSYDDNLNVKPAAFAMTAGKKNTYKTSLPANVYFIFPASGKTKQYIKQVKVTTSNYKKTINAC